MPILRKAGEININGIPPITTLNMPLNIGLSIQTDNSAKQLGMATQTQASHQQALQFTTQNVSQEVTQQVSIENRISVFMLRIVEKAKEYKEKTTTFVMQHKGLVLAGVAVSAYASLLYGVLSGNDYLQNADLWSEWQADMGDELLAAPQEEVAQALVREVQERYVNGENPSDFISPFIAFVRDVEQEEKWLKRYQMLYEYLSPIGGTYVFPFEEELYEELEERIARLAYLTHLYRTWIAAYKMTKHSHKNIQFCAERESLLTTKPCHATNA